MNYKYFQFPLIMLKDVHENFDTGMQRIINYASVDFALKQQISVFDVARDLLYSYHRAQSESYYPAIQALIEKIDNGIVDINEDYVIFDGNGNVDENIINDMVHVLESDQELYQLAILNNQLRNINSFFSMQGSDPNIRLSAYTITQTRIEQHESKYGKDPRPTIETGLFWDLYKGDADPVLFCTYMAIRSIEGQKKFAQTDKHTITGRMVGAKTKQVLDSFNPSEHEPYSFYSNRYRFDKLIARLIKRGLVKAKFGEKGWRKFFISTKLEADILGQSAAEHFLKKDAMINMKQKNDIALQSFRNKITATL